MNRALPSLHGGLLEITLKVPLRESVQTLLNDGLLISIMVLMRMDPNEKKVRRTTKTKHDTMYFYFSSLSIKKMKMRADTLLNWI